MAVVSRNLILAGLAATLIASCSPTTTATAPAVAPAVSVAPSASAERVGGDVKIGWQGLAGPVDLYTLPGADAPRSKGRRALAGLAGDTATLAVPASPRPWFLLRDARGTEVRFAERLLPLEGGVNFRDLGGYRTGDGQNVRWGKLYRSGVMAGLTASDFGKLDALGVHTICDFRAADERRRDAVDWPATNNVNVLSTDYRLDMAPLMAAFTGGTVTAETTRAAMAGFYRELPFNFAPQYKRMFAELVAGHAPLAFNCSAGKDRTGVAAVLVLSALGVPRETAIEDYLLSNRYYRPAAPRPGAAVDPQMAMFARLPADAREALMGVDRRYIEASLAAIDEKGGMDRFLREDLGISDMDRATLRKLYLTR